MRIIAHANERQEGQTLLLLLSINHAVSSLPLVDTLQDKRNGILLLIHYAFMNMCTGYFPSMQYCHADLVRSTQQAARYLPALNKLTKYKQNVEKQKREYMQLLMTLVLKKTSKCISKSITLSA